MRVQSGIRKLVQKAMIQVQVFLNPLSCLRYLVFTPLHVGRFPYFVVTTTKHSRWSPESSSKVPLHVRQNWFEELLRLRRRRARFLWLDTPVAKLFTPQD